VTGSGRGHKYKAKTETKAVIPKDCVLHAFGIELVQRGASFTLTNDDYMDIKCSISM